MKNLGTLWWGKLTGIIGKSDTQKCRVNCWFCNGNFHVDVREKEQWNCPSCEQYNGFNEDGDYNKPANLIFEGKQEKTPTLCKTPSPEQPISVLCHSCNQNQTLKARQLASFVPLSESTYDEEISSYRNYLEHIYGLCDSCQWSVEKHLTKQNNRIENELGEKLHDSQEHTQILKNDSSQKFRDSKQPLLLSSALFSLSCVASISLALLQLRFLLEAQYRLQGGFFHFIYTCLDSLLYSVPVKNVTYLEHSLVFAGAIFCVIGLFAVGKYSLYTADAFQVSLWLLSFLSWVAVPATFLRNAVGGTLVSIKTRFALSVSILLTALICIFKGRLPRNISNVRIFMKPVAVSKNEKEDELCSQSNPEMESSVTTTGSLLNSARSHKGEDKRSLSCSSLSSTSSSVGDAENMFVPISSSPLKGRSPIISSNAPSPLKSMPDSSWKNMRKIQEFPADSENVRQDLEMFTLGLGKKSGSTSSIWSIPSIVTSSPSQSPDSTQKILQRQPLNRSLLSPSRLGFLSFGSSSPDSGNEAYNSPFVPSSASKWRDSRTRENSQSHRDFHIDSSTQTPIDSSSSSHPMFSSHQSTYSYRTQCDSSTNSTARNALKLTKMQPSQSASKEENFSVPDSSSSYGHGADENSRKGPRRSSRIAMLGKVIKPWPLKKSFSLDSMYDRKSADLAGHKARAESRQTSFNQSIHEENLYPPASSGFQSYRPTSAFRQPAHVTNSGDSWNSAAGHLGVGSHARRRLPKKIEEFSDEEEDREERDFRRIESKTRQRTPEFSKHSKDPWSTAMLVLFGLIIGISVTTNAFLLWTLLRNP